MGLVVSLVMASTLLLSVYMRRLDLTKYIVGIVFLFMFLDQGFIFMERAHMEDFEIEIALFKNFIRATMALLVSQFLMNKPLKIFFVLAHFLFSLLTFYFMVDSLHMLEDVFHDHHLDVI
mmetsp:Transcript_9866/g.14928  ORF Transcript_9866/g.14928 Transcript_9866/m.14928 type:complete len:120 (+) Transcript_9866:629-988(+)